MRVGLQKRWWWFQTQFLRLCGMRIGALSYVAKPIMLLGCKNIVVGNRVRIFPGVRMETYDGGKIIVEDNVAIGQNFHITSCQEELTIGANTTILGNVFVTNIDHNYQQIGVHVLEQEYLVRKTQIGANCFIGYGAAIQAGTILGKQCVVGANSVVRGEFPDYSVLVGAPARVIKQYNTKTEQWEKITH